MSDQIEPTLQDGIYLADGTWIAADAGLAEPDLWIWYRDIRQPGDFDAAAQAFSDPEKTAKITYVYAGGRLSMAWEGYTHLVAILTDGGGHLNIRMREEEQ